MITAILATDIDGNIGNEGKLLANIPSDLKRFKKITAKGDVIMGRKTFDSIPEKFRPLPGRKNFIITKGDGKEYLEKYGDRIEIVDSLNINVIRELTEKELFIIGGAEIYNKLGNLADKIELTLINKSFGECDANVELKKLTSGFKLINKSEVKKENGFDFEFITYKK